MMLNDSEKNKAVQLFAEKIPKMSLGEGEGDGSEEVDGQVLASQSMLGAIESNDPGKFNQSLKDWFDLYAGAEESYSDAENTGM